MTRAAIRSALFFITSLLLISGAAAQTQQAESSVMHYRMYVTPWVNSYGQNIGIQVHYSVGSMMDVGQSASYSAVCVGWSYAPCLEEGAQVWTSTTTSWYPAGYWVVQNVPLNCDSTLIGRWVQVHQPYVSSWSGLNFPVSGGSPYRQVNGYPQLFYYGSSDTAKLQLVGCYQAYY